jgi:type I restriction enzyme, S subunit
VIRTAKLGEVAEVQMGQAPAGTSYNDSEQGFPLIAGAGDLGPRLPRPSRHTTSPTKVCAPGDIILCVRATIGDINIADREYCLGRGVAGLRAKRGIERSYLGHALKHVTPALVAQGRGSTFLQVGRAAVEGVEIPLPPIEQQRKIAAILDKADAIRRKRDQAIALTGELLRSTFHEMFGDPMLNDKGWIAAPLGELLDGEVRNGVSPSSRGSLPAQVLTLSAITGKQFIASAVKEGMFDLDGLAPDKLVHEDLFLVCRGNGNHRLVGAGRFPTQAMHDVVFPDTMIAIPVDLGRLCKSYLEALWQTQFIRRQIQKAARTTNGTYKINQRSLMATSVLVPPMQVQRRYDRFCERVPITRSAAARFDADALFDSLVHRAFSGQL